MTKPGELTQILLSMSTNPAARDALWQTAYSELRALAASRMRKSFVSAIDMSPTLLVNEAWLRLSGQKNLQFADRRYFFSYASCVMRAVVVDLAREANAVRRGGGVEKIALNTVVLGIPSEESNVLAIHDALLDLEKIEPQLAKIVELRYFSGLTEAEVSECLGMSERTVRRNWIKARAILFSMLQPE